MDLNAPLGNEHWSVSYKQKEIGFGRSQVGALGMAFDFLRTNGIQPVQGELTIVCHYLGCI